VVVLKVHSFGAVHECTFQFTALSQSSSTSHIMSLISPFLVLCCKDMNTWVRSSSSILPSFFLSKKSNARRKSSSSFLRAKRSRASGDAITGRNKQDGQVCSQWSNFREAVYSCTAQRHALSHSTPVHVVFLEHPKIVGVQVLEAAVMPQTCWSD
jgi:hypothetical protein